MPRPAPPGHHVAPSILSADFARLGEQVAMVLDAGARVIHVDVMDGHFVPPISFGAIVVEAIADRVHAADAVVEVHLMIDKPEHRIDPFVEAGADIITIHAEATAHINYGLARIREAGCQAGLAITPSTPPEAVGEVLDLLDVALCMTVNPGWGGQPFLESSLSKLRRLRAIVGEDIDIEVDGGIDADTAAPCAAAGATRFVAGSAVYGEPDPAAAFAAIGAAVEERAAERTVGPPE